MEQYGLTSAGWFQAPAPFKCGPKERFPITGKFSSAWLSAHLFRFLLCIQTGFWDYEEGRENNEDAYANALGRVDVEGW